MKFFMYMYAISQLMCLYNVPVGLEAADKAVNQSVALKLRLNDRLCVCSFVYITTIQNEYQSHIK